MATDKKIEKDLKRAATKIEKSASDDIKMDPAIIKPVSKEKKEDIDKILKKVLK